jgi:hypothetical protein
MNDERNDKKCNDLIDDKLNARFEDYQNILNLNDLSDPENIPESEIETLKQFIKDQGYDPNDYDNEDDLQELKDRLLSEYGLAAIEYKLIRIELSYGGPQDYIELRIDKEDNTLLSGTYHYLDWYDGAIRSLNQNQLDVIESLYSYLWDY